MKNKVNKMLNKLNEESYSEFKKFNSGLKKKQFKINFFNIVYTGFNE